jgi:hypothetical protein
MKRVIVAVLTVLFLASGGAMTAVAGVKTIKPNQLLPLYSDYVYRQSANSVSTVGNTPATFTAEVKLPVGKTIESLVYFHSGYGAPATWVQLRRTKMGVGDEQVGLAESNMVTGSSQIRVEEPIEPGLARVKKGYIYYITVHTANETSFVHGIKIIYR